MSSICIVNSFIQTDVTDEEWKLIQRAKTQVVIDKNPSIKYLRFPGLVSDSKENAVTYFNDAYSKITKVDFPPRGNISSKCNVAIFGIKPGMFLSKYNNHESAWIFGPSSKMLNMLMEAINEYPYFSNVFHYRDTDENDLSSLDQVRREMSYLKSVNKDVNILFLGKYPIFDVVKQEICDKLNIKSAKIWHPAYLCRSFTKEKFASWCNTTKNILEQK